MYLREGLVQSEFVNLKIRQPSAETSHDFIEWCGLLKDAQENQKLIPDTRIYMNEMYFDFINEYPDYGPKSKMTISRQRFYKWITAYCSYKTGENPKEGRDMTGKWFMMTEAPEETEDNNTEFIPF